jgi:hypothetical protein
VEWVKSDGVTPNLESLSATTRIGALLLLARTLYAAGVAKLPMICPPLGPSVVAMIAIPVFAVSGIAPWLLLVGILLFALWPQWHSCIFGLLDFLAACAVLILGAAALARTLVA